MVVVQRVGEIMDLSPNLTAARLIQNQRYYSWTTSQHPASIDVHELQVWSILIGGFCPSSISLRWFLSHKLWHSGHSTATPGHLHLQIPRRCNGSICLKSPLKGLEIQDASHRCTWAPIKNPKVEANARREVRSSLSPLQRICSNCCLGKQSIQSHSRVFMKK